MIGKRQQGNRVREGRKEGQKVGGRVGERVGGNVRMSE